MSVPAIAKEFKVSAPDGVMISAQACGKAGGGEIVFIHGLMQCHLSWAKQVESSLGNEFRLVTYDVRGHGGSDKTLDASLYGAPERFADELNAVMAAAGLQRPTLVGWSFGTRIIADYLLKYGAGRIAAINLVAPILSQDANHFGSGIEHVMKARDDDYVTSVTATRAFLRSCFAKQPTQEEFETMLVFNANVPVKVRQWMRRATSDADAVQAMLKSLDLPVLITHGVKDQLPSVRLSQWLATIIPGARLSLYQEAGHAPFFEEPERFNAELAELVRDAKSHRSDVG
jgi:non-heme chloroperoxidase